MAAHRKKHLAKEENTDITKRPDISELWIVLTGIFLLHWNQMYSTVLINECSSMGEDTVHVYINSIAG